MQSTINTPKLPIFRSYVFYLLAALFLLFEMALQVSPSMMTSELMQALSIDAAGLGLMSGVYFYSYTIMQIPAGLIYDRYSSRWIITTMLLVCVSGAFFFAGSDTLLAASLGRFLMGIGSAFAFIGVTVVAGRWFPAYYFAFLVGVAQLLAAIGAMGGEAPLGAMVDVLGWRQSIYVLVALGGLLALIIGLVLRDRPKGAADVVAPEQWKVKKSLKTVAGSKQTWWVGLYAFTSWAPVTAFASLWGVPYLVELYGISTVQAGLAIMMIWVSLGITSPIIGWLSNKMGVRCALLQVSALFGLVSSLIILYVPGVPFWFMFILFIGFGIGNAGQILTFAVVNDNNESPVMATAVGFNNMAVVAGGALFQPLVGFLLRWMQPAIGAGGSPIYTVESYRIALVVVPLCFAIGWFVGRFRIRETFCKAQY